MTSEFKEENLVDLLPLYYKRIFPYAQFYHWLSYGNKQYFAFREISYTLLDDIYIRYLCYDTQQAFITDLQKRYPLKIDIGAVYNAKPKDRRAVFAFTPEEKELVFDIDLTDYDSIRNCCQEAEVCQKCWKFMTIACKILDATLREDFGFEHLLYVFSGRRGIHLWVCDEQVRKFSAAERDAVANYIHLISKKKFTIYGDKIHYHIQRALKIINEHFIEIAMKDQEILKNAGRVEKFLECIENIDMRNDFAEAMKKGRSSEERWGYFVSHFEHLQMQNQVTFQMKNLINEIKIHFVYPRLDINVSTGMNHLLKAPFCVHPKTGKICIPFSIKLVGKFDPHKVPKINELVDEINAYDAKTKQQEEDKKTEDVSIKKIRDYKKTKLLKPVNIFEEFLKGLDVRNKAKEGGATIAGDMF